MADKVDDELVARVSFRFAIFLEDLVGKVGTSFEGEFFGKDEGVVTVEEELCDLNDSFESVAFPSNVCAQHWVSP